MFKIVSIKFETMWSIPEMWTMSWRQFAHEMMEAPSYHPNATPCCATVHGRGITSFGTIASNSL